MINLNLILAGYGFVATVFGALLTLASKNWAQSQEKQDTAIQTLKISHEKAMETLEDKYDKAIENLEIKFAKDLEILQLRIGHQCDKH